MYREAEVGKGAQTADDPPGVPCSAELIGWIFLAAGCGNEWMSFLVSTEYNYFFQHILQEWSKKSVWDDFFDSPKKQPLHLAFWSRRNYLFLREATCNTKNSSLGFKQQKFCPLCLALLPGFLPVHEHVKDLQAS